MAPSKRVYKINTREVERLVALYTVTKEDAKATSLAFFCAEFSIPLDTHNIAEQVVELEVLANALRNVGAEKKK